MTKKILHLQIPMMDTKTPVKDAFAVRPETLSQFAKMIKERVGDEWVIIASPFDPTISEDGQTFYNFKMDQLTKEELINLIK